MRGITSLMSFFAAIFLLAACASTANNTSKVKIDDVLTHANVLKFPYKTSADGHLVIPVSLNGGEMSLFAIDTGATKSVIFRRTSTLLNLRESENGDTLVHGLVDTEARPLVTLAKLEIGHHQFLDINVALLENRHKRSQSGRAVSGLIGLDILSRFRLYLDAEKDYLYLIPGTAPAIRKPSKWKHIPLMENPYAKDGRDLKFFMADFDGRKSPVLLDSGSSVNFMNWEIAKHPKIKRLKKKLKKQWAVEGATGTFNPTIYVRLEGIYSGDKYWHEPFFVVTDVSSLDVLGISGKPFAIAGVDMLAADSFYLDFANNTLFLQDRTKHGFRQMTGSRFRRPNDSIPENLLTFEYR